VRFKGQHVTVTHTLAILLLFGSPCSLASPKSKAAKSSANKPAGMALAGNGEPSVEKLLYARRCWFMSGEGANKL